MLKWLTKAFTSGSLTPADPALARFASTTGILGESPSGKAVTVDTSLQLSAVWACVRLISQTISTLPLVVYRTDANGNREVAPDHQLYPLLMFQPNSDMTPAEFWEAMIACVLLWGNGYAYKDYNALGDVISLTLLDPMRMGIRRMPDGSLLYSYAPWNGPLKQFQEDELFHLKGWSLNGLLGLSPIAYARGSLGTALAADEAAGKFFANGLAPSGFVETGGAVLTQPQRDRFKESLNELRGSGNTGKVMLLEGPFKYNALSLTPDDAQLLASRQFSVSEVCRWFAVPENMVGHAGTTTWGSGIEQLMLAFVTHTLRPWMIRVEQRVTRSLLKPAERGKIVAEYNVESLLRGDSAAQAALFSVYAQNGVMTRNEMRRKLGLPPMAGGDELTVQANLILMRMMEMMAALQQQQQQRAQTPGNFGTPDAAATGSEPVKQ